jgi:carboxypeptidase Taq
MKHSELLEHYKKISTLQSVRNLLSWDEEVCLPSDSTELRQNQNAVLQSLIHQELTKSAFVDAIRATGPVEGVLSKRSLDVLKRMVFEAAAITPEFQKRKTAVEQKSFIQWTKAKEANNFQIVVEAFQEQIDIQKEYVQMLQASPELKELHGLSEYGVMLNLNGAGLTEAQITPLFEKLKTELLPRVQNIANEVPPAIVLSEELQKYVLKESLLQFGFDLTKGRLDYTERYPFCGGSPGDVRITTRGKQSDFVDVLLATMHELGHGLYEQNMPEELINTPCGQNIYTSLHESQSRFLENQIARANGFIKNLSKISHKPLDTLRAAMRPRFKTLIRVAADEVSYNLHIILRWELEQKLNSGDLKAQDLPQAWNELFKKYFNMDVPDDAHGCLQDVHWYMGSFGWFPTYAIGNLIAAELFADMKVQLPFWESDLAEGKGQFVNEFLRDRVHKNAGLDDFSGLLSKALGARPLGVEALIQYLDERYTNSSL